MQQLPKRQAVPEALTWDLTKIFATDADWEAAYAAVEAQAQATAGLQGTLGASADALAAGLEAVFATFRAFENVYVYASMKSDQDTADAHYQGYKAKAGALGAKVSAQTAFLEPEILAIPADTLSDWQANAAVLTPYAHNLAKIVKTRAHVLSASEESLLSAAGDALGSSRATFNVLNNADLKFGTVKDAKGNERQLSNGVYGQLLRSTNRDVREQAFKALYAAYGNYKGTFASTLAGETKRHNFLASAHHYPSARAAAMAHNDIPEPVFDTLLAQVNAHLPLLHRYVALRKRLLALPELHMYDLYTPLTGEPPLSYTFDEAKAEAKKALAPLGEDYLDHVDEIFDNRYIDVVENQGKRSGAYSGGAYDTPPYELLNWQDGLDALFTLVHETGHSVHSWYTRHNQPYQTGDYPIFVAEIASTSNENLLTDYFLKTQSDPKVRAYILNHYLDGFKGTVFRQTQFAEFEHWIHEQDAAGNPLTAAAMSQFYGDLNARYYGPDVARDPEIALEWARIPHFYMNYYVYQYSTGFAAAATLASRISAGVPGAVDKYLGYLKSGSSQYPIDTMKAAGVDMTQPDYLEDAFAVFEQRLDELEALIAETR
ncbi:oligoendopeptidase F [Lacticaseibacillus absianus]|uniref:oligoendopeptidase F n=1 Tax=Lacticaseibacillus absianus TaxID=2729623 RepID=UPI0015C72482|nr:oligoendopeptidase F [Lacticaseibacillus absianus]